MILYENEVIMTPEELEDLDDYSCSLPSLTTIGKTWKNNSNAYRRGKIKISVCGLDFAFHWPDNWSMGEYIEIGSQTRVGIKWRKIIIGQVNNAPK